MPPAGADEPLRFDHFDVLPVERQLRIRGEPVAVGGRAFDLLLVLAERRGQVVGKQELLDLVWPGLVVEEHNIATQIGTLRKLLGADAITTVAGRGYRLTAAAPAASATAPVSAASLHHNLPAQRTRFIGREAALADLARLRPETRLLTLVGIGGCGKTRLALQFAHSQLEAFEGGVWFVDLAPLRDGGRVASACAAVLGVRDDGDAPLLERLLARLTGRHTLLVLDNCEHVLDAAASLVDTLLAAAGGTTILATSREALGVKGEQVYPLGSLSLPATDDLPVVLLAESVRVFVDRARLLRPEFEVDRDNAAPLAELCRRLDGIALAIELAAARITVLSVAEIAARLDDRFRLLTGGARTLPRHQTLQAAMQWSYEQLAPAEQRMLRLMSVFAGGWTLRGAADVAQTADEYGALTVLSALHDKSLLVVERPPAPAQGAPPAGAGPVPGAPGSLRTWRDAADGSRYRMLETVRQYALDRLNECGDAEVARSRHLAHCVAMAEEAEPHLRGPDQDAWIRRLRLEQENLIAALTWCCEGRGDPQSGLRLAAATSLYWVWNGVELGHRLAHAVLDRDRAANDTLARAGTLNAIARLSLFRGRYEESLAYSRQALAAARCIGEPRALVLALDNLGSALNTLGRVDEALACHEEALALARGLGDASLLAPMLNGIAESKRSAGQLGAAETGYREALELARAHGGRLAIVVPLNNLIRVLVAQGRPAEARGLALECLPLVRHEKVSVDLLEATVGLASRLGAHEQAARFWGAADQALREWGYRHQPVDIEHTAPLIASSRSALGAAAFEAAEAAGRALGHEAALLELEQWLERVA